MHSEKASLGLRLAAWGGLVFLHFPILIIFLYAFNTEDAAFSFPPKGFTWKWIGVAFSRPDVLEAIKLSLQIASIATLIAMVLGTLASAALYRRDFFGKQGISLMLILPIALPGIITGIALLATFKTLGIEPGMFTIIVGHATFCVVIVYNNVIARLRRTSHSLIEASMDLGADGWQTLRHVILPQLGSALLAGALLAFALSFDEVIVTTFTAGQQTTLPIWMLQELIRPRQRPVTNVVAVFVIALTFVPIVAAYLLTRSDEAGVR